MPSLFGSMAPSISPEMMKKIQMLMGAQAQQPMVPQMPPQQPVQMPMPAPMGPNYLNMGTPNTRPRNHIPTPNPMWLTRNV